MIFASYYTKLCVAGKVENSGTYNGLYWSAVVVGGLLSSALTIPILAFTEVYVLYISFVVSLLVCVILLRRL